LSASPSASQARPDLPPGFPRGSSLTPLLSVCDVRRGCGTAARLAHEQRQDQVAEPAECAACLDQPPEAHAHQRPARRQDLRRARLAKEHERGDGRHEEEDRRDGPHKPDALEIREGLFSYNGQHDRRARDPAYVPESPGGPRDLPQLLGRTEIYKIPPSSPVYNITHQHVYQSTPQVVFVGYTPGYMWSFP